MGAAGARVRPGAAAAAADRLWVGTTASRTTGHARGCMLDSYAMIEVRLYANLAPEGRPVPRLASGAAGFEMGARPGLTVRDVLLYASLKPEDVAVVMINHVRGDLDSSLTDGDRLGLFPAVAGG